MVPDCASTEEIENNKNRVKNVMSLYMIFFALNSRAKF
jgi:hypothetical protein